MNEDDEWEGPGKTDRDEWDENLMILEGKFGALHRQLTAKCSVDTELLSLDKCYQSRQYTSLKSDRSIRAVNR